jgi:hypothetical protein
MSEPTKPCQPCSGGLVMIRCSIEEDEYLATFHTHQGVTLRWIAPRCAMDIENAHVDLAARNLDLKSIVFHPSDLKIYNSTFLPATRVYLTDKDGKTEQIG